MKFNSYTAFLLCIFAGAFLFVSHIAFSDDQQPPAPPATGTPAPSDAAAQDTDAKIAKLIEQLGDADFDKREAAQKELKKIGEPARTALTKALKNDDPEIAYRASQALTWLNLAHVTLEITDTAGNPIADRKAALTIRWPDEYMRPEPMYIIEKILPKDGKISLEPCSPGTYYVRINVEGYCRDSKSLAFGKGDCARKITLYKGGSIKCKFVDVKNDNKPLANTRFRVSPGIEDGPNQIVTDQNGEFLMKQLPPGKQYLHFEERDHNYFLADGDSEGNIQIDVKDEETTEVTISMMDRKWFHGKVEGNLVTPDGKPYERDWKVTYRMETGGRDAGEGGAASGGGNTGPEGGYRYGVFKLDVPQGKYTLVIEAEGYAARILKSIEVKGNETMKLPEDIKLEKGTPLKVKVLDMEGKPAPEACVMLTNTDDPPRVIQFRNGNLESYFPWDTGRTGADGCCEFLLVDGQYALRAYDTASGMSDETIVDVKASGEPPVVEIAFKTGAMTILAVVDKETGQAVPNVQAQFGSTLTREFQPREAEVKHEGYIWVESPSYFKAKQDDKGRFLLPPSYKGDKLLLYAQGYKPAVYTVEEPPAGKPPEATCPMEQLGMGNLRVTLVPGKDFKLESMAEAYVNGADTLFSVIIAMREPDPKSLFFRWGTKVTPDKGGVFEARGLVEGAYYVSLFDKNGMLIAVFRTDVEKGKAADVKLNVPGVGKIEGVLTDSAGNKMSGAEVTLMPDSVTMSLAMLLMAEFGPGKFMPTAIADENGRFTFDAAPEGNYVLVPGGQAGVPETRLVSVTAGNSVNADMQLLEPMDVTLTFKEKPEQTSGMLVAENSAGLLRLAIPPSPGTVVETHGEGPPKLSGIRPGKHVLLIVGDRPFGFLQQIEVTPDTKSIEVEGPFDIGKQTIKGKITRLWDVLIIPTGMGLVLAVGERSFALGFVFPDGSFEIYGLHPDKYRLMPVSLDEACTNRADIVHLKEVTVEEGKDLEGVEIP